MACKLNEYINKLEKSLPDIQDRLNKKYMPEFDKLPEYQEGQHNLTVATIGSRETPPEVLEKMTSIGKYLSNKGYILQSGGAIGADMAFEGRSYPKKLTAKNEVKNKKGEVVLQAGETVTIGTKKFTDAYYVFSSKDNKGQIQALDWVKNTPLKNIVSFNSFDITQNKFGNAERVKIIANELHPSEKQLSKWPEALMARNTYQVFGKNLDKPVDFVLFYAEESEDPLRPKGGTGQAVEMARRKGIPTINMAEEGWRDKLINLLKKQNNNNNKSNKKPSTSEEESILQAKVITAKKQKKSGPPWEAKDTDGIVWVQRVSLAQLTPLSKAGQDFSLIENFGNPFVVDKKNGYLDMEVALGNAKEVSIMYYNWLKNGTIPIGYPKEQIENLTLRREYILNNLDKIRNAKELWYWKNPSNEITHVDALVAIAYEQNKQINVQKENWTRKSVKKDPNKVYIFGDNTNDRVKTHYIPSSTQAVIRGLPNAFGIDTKKSRTEQFTTDDYSKYVRYLDKVFERLNKMKEEGIEFVVSKNGIGTGKADLPFELHNALAERFNKFVGQNLIPYKESNSIKMNTIENSIEKSINKEKLKNIIFEKYGKDSYVKEAIEKVYKEIDEEKITTEEQAIKQIQYYTIPWQHSPGIVNNDNKLFNKLAKKMKQIYPEIKVKQINAMKDQYGFEVVGKIINDIIFYEPTKAGLDTLPHEYAHHYIRMFIDAPIVKEAIKKWGSEEELVQAIGEQVVKQKGEVYGWWKKFSTWVRELFNKLPSTDKEELRNLLTDAFLTRKDLAKNKQKSSTMTLRERKQYEKKMADQAIKEGC